MSLFSESVANEMAANQGPMVSFGLFSDVQHSGKNDYVKVRGPDVFQYHSESSLKQLREAVEDWNQNEIPVSFVLSLGDLSETVDDPQCDRDSALLQVLDVLEKCPRPKYYVLGHHELKQFTRKELYQSKVHSAVNAPGAIPANHDKFYYHFSPTPGVRIIVIDTYEVSTIGYQDDEDCDEFIRGKQILKEKNPNANSRDCENMPWHDAKYTCLNGATSSIQLQWLVEVLDYCEKTGETVIVCGHNPLCVSEKKNYCRVSWNNEDTLGILHRFPCVVAYLSGHSLDGGYLQDNYGVHHISLPGICHTPPTSNSYATLHVFGDRLELHGCGRMPSMNLLHHGQAQIIATMKNPEPPIEPQPEVLPPTMQFAPPNMQFAPPNMQFAPPNMQCAPPPMVQTCSGIQDRMVLLNCQPEPEYSTVCQHVMNAPKEVLLPAQQTMQAPREVLLPAQQTTQGQCREILLGPQQSVEVPQEMMIRPQQATEVPQEMMMAPATMAVQQPAMEPMSVLPYNPPTRRIVSTRPIPVMTTKAANHRSASDIRPPPIVAARLEEEARRIDLGPIRKAVPVTVAVPIERINAMGGIKNFQLAQVPKAVLDGNANAGLHYNGQRLFF